MHKTSSKDSQHPLVQTAPFRWVSGGEFSLKPEEQNAIDCLGASFRIWRNLLYQTNLPATRQQQMDKAFVKGIHLAQLAVSGIRFFHVLNQNYRKHNPVFQDQPLLLTDTRKITLKRWQQSLEGAMKQYDEGPLRDIHEAWLQAWQHAYMLATAYPDQHTLEEFVDGIEDCQTVLRGLCTFVED